MSEFIIKVTVHAPGQPEGAFVRTAVVDYTDPAELETMVHAFINSAKAQGNPGHA